MDFRVLDQMVVVFLAQGSVSEGDWIMTASNRINVDKAILILMLVVRSFLSSAFANEADNSYRPNDDFLKQDPYKKSKARVDLIGVKNDHELKIVQSSINDILRFIRLFGLSNKNLDGSIILENTRKHPAFLMLTTERGRRELDIDPASSRIEQKVYNWAVESDRQLSVDVLLIHQPLWRGPTETPSERIYRFKFVKNQCEATWCLNEVKRIE